MRTSPAARFPVLADSFLPPNAAADALAVFTASLFIAVCAQVEFHLPFTPIPISGGTLGVLYAGALLGSRRGAGCCSRAARASTCSSCASRSTRSSSTGSGGS